MLDHLLQLSWIKLKDGLDETGSHITIHHGRPRILGLQHTEPPLDDIVVRCVGRCRDDHETAVPQQLLNLLCLVDACVVHQNE